MLKTDDNCVCGWGVSPMLKTDDNCVCVCVCVCPLQCYKLMTIVGRGGGGAQ